MQELPLNGFYESTTQKNSARRCVNLIPINEPNGSLSTNMLECPPGITGPVTGTAYSGLISGAVVSQVYEWKNNNVGKSALFCYRNRLYFTEGTSAVGVQIPNFGASVPHMFGARFASSPDTLVGVNDGTVGVDSCGFSADKNLSVTTIDLDTIFGTSPHGITDVAFLGGRFIWMNGEDVGGNAFRCYYSDIGGTDPVITQFFQPDIDTTEFTGIHVLSGQLWLFDNKRAYLFSLTSSTTTPFQWQRSATREVGLYSSNTKAQAGGILFMIGSDESGNWVPVAFNGGQATRIGTPAVDYAVNADIKTTSLTPPKVFSYHDNGREYVAFTTGLRTFVYSLSDQRWFERDSGSGYWDVIGFAGRDSEVYVGQEITVSANATLQIGNADYDDGMEFGESIERFTVSAPFNANNATIKLSELEPVISSVGGEDADVTVSISKDFGDTFGTERTITKTGDSSRTRFLGWGAFRQAAVVKIKVVSDFPVKIVKLLARMTTGGRGA